MTALVPLPHPSTEARPLGAAWKEKGALPFEALMGPQALNGSERSESKGTSPLRVSQARGVAPALLDRPGAIALVSVLTLGVVALAVALTVALRGVGELELTLGLRHGEQALALAEGCAEETLLRLSRDPNYIGGSLSAGFDTCTSRVLSVSDGRRIVSVDARSLSTTRHLRVNAQVPPLKVSRWEQTAQ